MPSTAPSRSVAARGTLSALLILVLTGAALVSVIEGSPGRLPGIALGSVVLFHIERAAALFVLIVALLSVLAHAAHGRLPTHITTAGLSYETDTTVDTETAIAELQEQLDVLQHDVRVFLEPVSRIGTIVDADR